VVWELTLSCDHACTHCGSRAAVARDDELDTPQALRVVDELAALGAREVVLIGGEAYLHPGFLEVVAALARAGIKPSMTTGGKGITAKLAQQMAAAGLRLASVSIDGLRPTHDRMRASAGSFERATAALGHLRAAGIRIAANTNLNRLNAADLEPLYEHLRGQGIVSWQVQLTAPLGRAADRPELIVQPWDLLDLVPRLAALKQRALVDGIRLMPGNNLGYFGPEEALLRSPTADGDDHFAGCQAGRFVMGIESDGAIKGCPSLQTHAYAGATVRDGIPLPEIWATDSRVGSLRGRTVDDLWASAAAVRSRPPAWAGARSPRTRSWGGPATTRTVTSGRGHWRPRAGASGCGRPSAPRGGRSTMAASSSSKRISMPPTPAPGCPRPSG
jgi:MoaA/NifB/PqqE/SkfB family radical SAM enzyme